MSHFAKSFALLAFFAAVSHSAVNYPYPQAKAYGNNTINVTSNKASETLQSRFKTFLTGFYEEGTGANSNLARIKFDDTQYTVSEGIGYGMIMMVYFSDNTKSYQGEFDKLWAYYKKWPNGNGLMNWKIQGFSSVNGQNAATDAEFDVALALAMAYYQFGDEKYKTDATALIKKIRQFEMDSDGLHRPGDAWGANPERNPSYVSPAAFEIFKSFDTDGATFWSTAITRNYTLLKANQNSSTGLPSNWCSDNGTPRSGDNYGYDASRAPWRWAWANAWYGHADAKTLLGKLATWVNNQTVNNVGGSISLTGTLGGDKNSTFLGPFTNALSYSSTYQNKMNDYWTTMIGKSGEPYFSAAMQMITGLLATGNMPNLKALADAGGPKPSSNSNGSSSSGNSSYTRIDNFQELDSLARTYEAWYAFTDRGDDGASTLTNTVKGQTADGPEYIVVVQDGNDRVAKIGYTLSKGQNKYDPYAALGLNAVNNQKSASQGGYDLSRCSGGFRYDYKGSAHNFKIKMSTITDYAYHYIKVAASTAWKTETVTEVDLVQPTWTENPIVAFDATKVNGFDWEVKGDDATGSATTGTLAIRNFDCLGDMPLPPPPEGQSSGSGAGSSSSVAGGSSSSGGSGQSSSSGGYAGGSSSSGGNLSPIVLPQIAAANALTPMQNALSLQATGKVSLQIFDLKGTLARSMEFGKGSYLVPLKDLPAGLYVAKASGASWRQTIKIAVK